MDNSTYTGLDFGPVEDTSKQIIKVVGVGGGGCNAVKNMAEEGIANVSLPFATLIASRCPIRQYP